jgi:hypothetical protein
MKDGEVPVALAMLQDGEGKERTITETGRDAGDEVTAKGNLLSNAKAATEGRRPGFIPALGNAQGMVSPTGKGLKARHRIARKPGS